MGPEASRRPFNATVRRPEYCWRRRESNWEWVNSMSNRQQVERFNSCSTPRSFCAKVPSFALIMVYLAVTVVGCGGPKADEKKRDVSQETKERPLTENSEEVRPRPQSDWLGEIGKPIVPLGDDPKDNRILALVAYFGRHGFQFVHVKESWWKVVETDLPAAQAVVVSIRGFPENATESQMRWALQQINQLYELNVSAHLAMATTGNIKKDREQVRGLFLRYDPTKSN